MTKKPGNKEARNVTVGVLVTPTEAAILRRLAQAEDRSVSSLAYRILKESPTLRRELKSAAA